MLKNIRQRCNTVLIQFEARKYLASDKLCADKQLVALLVIELNQIIDYTSLLATFFFLAIETENIFFFCVFSAISRRHFIPYFVFFFFFGIISIFPKVNILRIPLNLNKWPIWTEAKKNRTSSRLNKSNCQWNR